MKSKKKVFLGCFFVMLCAMLMAMPVSAASAKLNKTKASVVVGKTVQLKVKNTKKKVKWSSSDKSVATVNSKGLVTAKKKGTATIKAKVGSKTLKCKVTVKKNTFTPKPKAWSKLKYCNLSSGYKVRLRVDKVFYDSKGQLRVDVTFKNFTSGHSYNLKAVSLTLRKNSSSGKILAQGYFSPNKTIASNKTYSCELLFGTGTKNVVNLNKCNSIYYSFYTN